MKQEPPPKPELCEKCKPHAKHYHFVLCGGLRIGLHTEPLSWRLRPKDEGRREAEKTRHLQRIAAAARLLHTIKKDSPQHAEAVDQWQAATQTALKQ